MSLWFQNIIISSFAAIDSVPAPRMPMRRFFQSGNLKIAGNEQTLTEPRTMVIFNHWFLDSVTSRNLNHDLRVKIFCFLDHVTCMRGLTIILGLKEKKCRLCKERIDRHVWLTIPGGPDIFYSQKFSESHDFEKPGVECRTKCDLFS